VKNFVLTLLIIVGAAALAVGGYFGYQKWFGQGPFLWGVTVRPHAVGNWNKNNWDKQTDHAKDLGINAARITWQYDASYKNKTNPIAFHDNLYETLKEKGMTPLWVVEPQPNKQITDYYKEGYDNGLAIASRYKGKVKYYQMMNEGGAQTIKSPTSNGQKTSDYDEAKYAIVREYMKGLSAGIKKGDSSAVRIITISWTHTGYLDKLAQDGIQYDWIGLDWYHWMGPIQDSKLDNGTMFVDKLKSYNKPLVFMEVNAWPKVGTVDVAAQSDFIQKTADWAWNNRKTAKVRGFFVFELTDNVNVASDNGEHFGLVEATVVNAKKKDFDIVGPRASFNTFKEIIKKYGK
jgi:hypothetical protein